MFSIMASTSASVTVADGRSTASSSGGFTLISGSTSKCAAYFRSDAGPSAIGSMRGPAAGRRLRSLTAWAKEVRISSFTTSARTCSPNCLLITASGALPGRKPFRRAVRDRRFSRCCTSWSTSVAGTATSRRRDRPPVSASETSFNFTILGSSGTLG